VAQANHKPAIPYAPLSGWGKWTIRTKLSSKLR
jgi:hypothetical protein